MVFQALGCDWAGPIISYFKNVPDLVSLKIFQTNDGLPHLHTDISLELYYIESSTEQLPNANSTLESSSVCLLCFGFMS